VVHHVPRGMEHPSDADEAIRLQLLVRTVGNDRRERKLPLAQPLRYAAPAPAIMMAMRFRRFGFLSKDVAAMNKIATTIGATTSMNSNGAWDGLAFEQFLSFADAALVYTMDRGVKYQRCLVRRAFPCRKIEDVADLRGRRSLRRATSSPVGLEPRTKTRLLYLVSPIQSQVQKLATTKVPEITARTTITFFRRSIFPTSTCCSEAIMLCSALLRYSWSPSLDESAFP